MDIIEKKKDLRKEYIRIRNKIEDKEEKSRRICEKIIHDELFIKSNVIALYKSLDSEVDTKGIIECALALGKKVALPKTIDGSMDFYSINLDETLVKSKFGVYEPTGEIEKLISKEQIDLIIVPGICFDLSKNRLGFGKGFYDKYLNGCNAYKIGICFEEQILERSFIPIDSNDISLDRIITEKRIY